MYCRNCGTKLDDSAIFCYQCGSKVKRENTGNVLNDTKVDSVEKSYVKNNKRKVIIAVILLMAAGIVAVSIPKLAKKVTVQQEMNKTEKAIEVALDDNELSEVEDFELPYFDQEKEKAFDEAISEKKEWQSAYVSALEDGKIIVSDFCTYALRDLDADGVPELFCYDDSIRTIYLYAFVDGGIKEVLCCWGALCVNDNFLFVDSIYSCAAYEYISGKAEELFSAERDETDVNLYHCEGNIWSYNDMLGELEKYSGVTMNWESHSLEFEYNKDSVSQAIVNYNVSSSEEMPQTDEEDQENMVETEVLPAYEKYVSENLGHNEYAVYNLIYMDDDGIPELLFDNTADGRGTVVLSYKEGNVCSSDAWCRGFDFYYVPKGNKVKYDGYMNGDVSSAVAHLEQGVLVNEHTCDFFLNKETGEGGTYYIDGAECTETEFNDFKETYFKFDNMVYGWNTYSSIREAYENLGKITFYESGGYITGLEMANNTLSVTTEDGMNISYLIDDNCEWLEMGSDGSVYGNHTFETLKEAVLEERARYLEAPEAYESPLILRLEIRNDTIVKICTSTP